MENQEISNYIGFKIDSELNKSKFKEYLLINYTTPKSLEILKAKKNTLIAQVIKSRELPPTIPTDNEHQLMKILKNTILEPLNKENGEGNKRTILEHYAEYQKRYCESPELDSCIQTVYDLNNNEIYFINNLINEFELLKEPQSEKQEPQPEIKEINLICDLLKDYFKNIQSVNNFKKFLNGNDLKVFIYWKGEKQDCCYVLNDLMNKNYFSPKKLENNLKKFKYWNKNSDKKDKYTFLSNTIGNFNETINKLNAEYGTNRKNEYILKLLVKIPSL
jgi:hypothetical protein